MGGKDITCSCRLITKKESEAMMKKNRRRQTSRERTRGAEKKKMVVGIPEELGNVDKVLSASYNIVGSGFWWFVA